MSYDYDRTAADKQRQPLMRLDFSTPLGWALVEHGTSHEPNSMKYRSTGDTTFAIEGKTRDGRDWKGTGRIYLNGWAVEVEIDVDVHGTVDMGPVPDFLDKADRLIRESIKVIDDRSFTRSLKWVPESVDTWRKGEPVDKGGLRSQLRDASQWLEGKMRGLEIQNFTDPTYKLIDDARKAANAAARKLK